MANEHATEVFDDGESNERWTKSQFFLEVVEMASETHPYLLFFVNLTPFPTESRDGPPTIRFGIKF